MRKRYAVELTEDERSYLKGLIAAGVLTATYGLGGLLGSAGVMIRPMRTDADPLMTWLGAAVGAALCGAAFAGTFPMAVAAYSFAASLSSFTSLAAYFPAFKSFQCINVLKPRM